jgi:type IV pilus assembly protein PilE
MSLKRGLHTTSCAYSGCAGKGPEPVATVCSACNTSNRLGLRSFVAGAYHAIAEKGEIAVSTKSPSPSRSIARTLASGGARGFTLLEVMIVVAIVAILAAIALPSYSDYIKRGKIIEATSALSDARTRFEQHYLDNRTYADAGANTCLAKQAAAGAALKAFDLDCCSTAPTGNTYLCTATGKASEGMTNFAYTINQSNVHATTGPAWGTSATCWVTRKDGSCN